MESESIAMIVGGIYVALSAGLSEEGIAAANDVLMHLANCPMATLEEFAHFKADSRCCHDQGRTRTGAAPLSSH